MIWMLPILNSPMLERMGWTLVHSVWECAAIAMLLAMVLLVLRGSRMRYLAACSAMVASLALPLGTFLILQPVAAAPRVLSSHPTVQTFMVEPSALLAPAAPVPIRSRSLNILLPVAAMARLVGVMALFARHLAGWISLRRLRRQSRIITDAALVDCLQRLIERLRIRRAVLLAESALVQVPSTIGWLRPIVLLPCSALAGLAPSQLEAILAHELAHVRRCDYLVNLIQTMIETLLFYHPAVWWISQQIRQEREHCCDDLAVSIVGDARSYGAALAAMEELRAAPELALAANGGSLLKRISRLMKPQPLRVSLNWPMLVLIAVIVGVAACTQVSTSRVHAQNQPALATTQPSTAPAEAAAEPGMSLEERMRIRREEERKLDAAKALLAAGAASNIIELRRADLMQLHDALNKRLVELKIQLLNNKNAYGPGHAAITQTEKQIAEMEKQLSMTQDQLYKLNADLQARLNSVAAAYYISGLPQSGMYDLPEGKDLPLIDVVKGAGGLRPEEQDKFIVIIHQFPVHGEKSTIIRANELIRRPVRVVPGDVIMVTKEAGLPLAPEERYSVLGDVPREGYYPLQRNMTLLQAIVAAGINPPDVPKWKVQWQRDAGGRRGRGPVGSNEIPMSDLVGGAIGMEPVAAGDRIIVISTDAPASSPAR